MKRSSHHPDRPLGASKPPARILEGSSWTNEGWKRDVRRGADPAKRERLSEARRLQALAEIPSALVAIRGRIGDVVYKTYGRKIIVTRAPSFEGYLPTRAQRERRMGMREATAWAKRVYAVPAAKALLVAVAKKLKRRAFRLAVSDYLRGHARVKAIELLLVEKVSAAAKVGVVVRAKPPTIFGRSPGCGASPQRAERVKRVERVKRITPSAAGRNAWAERSSARLRARIGRARWRCLSAHHRGALCEKSRHRRKVSP